jgi:hypothetical protein
MTLPKDTVKPAYNYTYPSERQYYDETGSTLAAGVVADPAKSGADYGITDPQVTEPIAGTSSETGNGAGTTTTTTTP